MAAVLGLEDADIVAACELLIGLGEARKEVDPLGSTNYYGATPAGVLAHEISHVKHHDILIGAVAAVIVPHHQTS